MRQLLVVALLCAVCAWPARAAAQDEWWKAGGGRVRPQDDRAVALLAAGLLRSAMLRDLVARVEASDVFVFVSIDPLMRPTLSGALRWMTAAGGFRYLAVGLNSGNGRDQSIATLGHELRHAIEVIEDVAVVDQKSLVGLYKRIGVPSRALPALGWETAAARDAGFQVGRELAASPVITMARRSDAKASGKGS